MVSTEAVKAPSGSLALLGLFVVYLLPMILMSASFVLIYYVLNLELALSSLQLYAVYDVSCWITFLVMLLLLWKQRLQLKDIGYRGDIDLATIGIAVLFSLAGLAVLAISSFALDCVGIRWSTSLDIEVTSAIDAVLLVFTLLVTSPVIEDTFYRAYSITVLERKLGNRWVAGLVSCFIFALVYLPSWGVRGSIQLFLWALTSMVLFVWRKSIYPCLLMHVANNVFMYVLLPTLGW
jgi:membrane protease YdiL (CAAX protease family)